MDTVTELRILEELARPSSGHGDFPPPAPVCPRRYLDADRRLLEMKSIFRTVWLPVAHESDLASAGRFVSTVIDGDSVAVVRGPEGLAAFHDVCLHRGARILREAAGTADCLRCPYHGFTYDLGGTLRAAPDPNSFGDPPLLGRGLRLPPIAVARHWGYVWVSLAEHPVPLQEFLGAPLTDELANWHLEANQLKHCVTFEGRFGWKVGVEAFLEALHVPTIHKHTANPLIDFRHASLAFLGDHSRMATRFRIPDVFSDTGLLGVEARGLGVESFPRLNRVQRSANFSYLIFPTTILNLLPNHLTVFRMLPMGPLRTSFVYELFGLPGDAVSQKQFFERVHEGYLRLVHEDMENLPFIEEGLRDQSLAGLMLSKHERRIPHFHETVDRYVAPPLALQGYAGGMAGQVATF
jgi:phenylpropionate dioxygenase-like ring-hydroxylating dioxygenase large terminal subunit